MPRPDVKAEHRVGRPVSICISENFDAVHDMILMVDRLGRDFRHFLSMCFSQTGYEKFIY